MTLPGAAAMQLATCAGWLLHGVRGGVVAGVLFILPGALVYASIGQGLETILADAAALDRPVGVGDLVTPGITLGLLGLALLAAIAPLSGFIRRKLSDRNA